MVERQRAHRRDRAPGPGCGERGLVCRRRHRQRHRQHRPRSTSASSRATSAQPAPTEIIDRLREATKDRRRAFPSSCRRCRMCRSTAASAARNTSTRLQDADADGAGGVGAEAAGRAAQTSRNWPTWPPTSNPSGLQVSVDVDRDAGLALNVLTQAIDDTLYDAFGQRQVSIIFTQLNQYRVVLEAEPQLPAHAGVAEQDLRQIHHRPDGAAERVCPARARSPPRWPSCTRASSPR